MTKRSWISVCIVLAVLALAIISIAATSTLSTKVDVLEPHTAFGELSVAELTPIVQLQFPYGVNTRLIHTTTGVSGSTTVSDSLITVSSGTTTGSHELMESVAHAKYHPGQGTLARWTAIYQSTGVATAEAIAGIGNDQDGFFFGYDGASFGILQRQAGRLEYQTLTITNGADSSGGTITITLDGVATEVEVVNNDSAQAVARAIHALTFNQWFVDIRGIDVEFRSHLASDKTGTFSFVDTDSTGVTATFAESIKGVASTDTWTEQNDWSEDNLDGDSDGDNPSGMTLDVSKGNVYQVQFQWLGFGEILFAIENPATGRFVDVHFIEYANNNTTPSLQNPTLPVYIGVDNGTSTSDIVIKSSSMAIFTEGRVTNAGPNFSALGELSGTVTTETAVLCVQNKRIFQDVENRVNIAPEILTFSANGAGAAKFHTLRITDNPILGGDPVFTDVGSNSIMTFDTAGTTLTGGSVIGTFEFGKAVSAFLLDLNTFSVPEPPGTLICFSVQTDGGTTDVSVGFLWRELF